MHIPVYPDFLSVNLFFIFFVLQLNYWQIFCATYSLLLMYIISLSNILYFVYFTFILFIQFSIVIFYMHSHKKQKNSLKSSLVLVLFAAEIDFSKILVLSLPQYTLNVSIESSGKSKTLYYLCEKFLRALIYLHFVILVLICF